MLQLIASRIRAFWNNLITVRFTSHSLDIDVPGKPALRFVESSPCVGSSSTLTALGIVPVLDGQTAVCPHCNEFVRVKHHMLVRHGYTRTRVETR